MPLLTMNTKQADKQLEQALKDLSPAELEGVLDALALVVESNAWNVDPIQGLYFVPPYGAHIASGAMKCFVKPRFDARLMGKRILVSGEKAFGTMTVERPIKVGIDEFDDLHGIEHCISRKERLQWWPESEYLYLYPVEEFKAYDCPRDVDVPPGVQTRMKEVCFQDNDVEDVAPSLTITIAKTPDQATKGFSGRDSIDPGEGLLIPLAPTTGIWMKDTAVPLSVAFLDGGYKVLQLTDLEPMDETIHLGPAGSAWALEASPSWFKSTDVEVGDVIRLPNQE